MNPINLLCGTKSEELKVGGTWVSIAMKGRQPDRLSDTTLECGDRLKRCENGVMYLLTIEWTRNAEGAVVYFQQMSVPE